MWSRREGRATSHQGHPHPQKRERCCAPLTLLLPQSLPRKIKLQLRQCTPQESVQTASVQLHYAGSAELWGWRGGVEGLCLEAVSEGSTGNPRDEEGAGKLGRGPVQGWAGAGAGRSRHVMCDAVLMLLQDHQDQSSATFPPNAGWGWDGSDCPRPHHW